MSFSRVVVLGGGPIGLLCAIEACKHFRDVTIVEKRADYSRLNVPILRPGIRSHLARIGAFEADLEETSTPLNRLEEALWSRAEANGVTMLRGFVVTGVVGLSQKKNDRYKSVALFLSQWDNMNKQTVHDGRRLAADLVIVASGGGAAADPLVLGAFGFTYERLSAKNYGAYAILEEEERVNSPAPSTSEEARAMSRARTERKRAAKAIAGQDTHFRTPDHNYLLVTLSGISESDFERLQGSNEKVVDLLSTLDRALNTGIIEHVKDVRRNVGIFSIEIQRARQFYSDQFPAVLVGDAAVTPHPDAGSGIETGFRGFEELQQLLLALHSTKRSNDNTMVYQNFNQRYELHASKKAVEGTANVLKHLRSMLQGWIADMELGVAQLSNDIAIAMVQETIERVGYFEGALHECMDRAVAFKELLDPMKDAERVPEWDASVGDLWRDIDAIYAELMEFSRDANLLDDRLEAVKARLT